MGEAATKLEMPSTDSWLQQHRLNYSEHIVEGLRLMRHILAPNNGLGVISVIQTPTTIEIDKAWGLEGIPVPKRIKELVYQPVFRYDRGLAIEDLTYFGRIAGMTGNFMLVLLDDYTRNAMKGVVRDTSIEYNLNRGRLELIVFEPGNPRFIREPVPDIREYVKNEVFIGPTRRYIPPESIRKKYEKPAPTTQLAA